MPVLVDQLLMGFVVPLPRLIQRGAEAVAARKRLAAGFFAFKAFRNALHHGEVLLPAHGHQHGDAPHRAVILEKHQVPVALGRLHHAALGGAVVSAVESLAEDLPAPELAFQRICHIAALGAEAPLGPMDAEEVVFPVVLVQVAAFPAQTFAVVPEDDAIHPAFPGGGKVA